MNAATRTRRDMRLFPIWLTGCRMVIVSDLMVPLSGSTTVNDMGCKWGYGLIEADVREIVEAYNRGATRAEIASKFALTLNGVSAVIGRARAIGSFRVSDRRPGLQWWHWSGRTRAEVLDMLNEGAPMYDVARRFSCSEKKIKSFLEAMRARGLVTRSPSPSPRAWSAADDETLLGGWNSGRCLRLIARDLGRSRNAVIGRANRLRAEGHNVIIRGYSNHRPSIPQVKPGHQLGQPEDEAK